MKTLSILLFLCHFRTTSCLCNKINNKIDLSRGKVNISRVKKTYFSGCPKDAQSLDLSVNLILSISYDSFYDLYSLTELNLAHNQISAIENGTLKFMRNLKTFDASNNHITYLDDSTFEGLVNLVVVKLDHNRIAVMDSYVFHKAMYKLEEVDLSFNALTYFEPWPYIPQQKQNDDVSLWFYLTHNNISQFTNKLNWSQHFQEDYEYHVQLMHNNIQEFSPKQLFKVYGDSVSTNPLTESVIYRMNISYNPIICDCNVFDLAQAMHLSVLFYVDVIETRITCGNPPELYGMDFMHDIELDKFVCNVSQDCPLGCFCQELPYTSELVVDCSNGNLTELPKTLPTPKYGNISLHLDNNHITRIDERSYMVSVRNLTISNNHVSFVDSNISMSRMKYLDISRNKLQYITKSIQVIEFSNVRINGNQFKCTCNMTWMKKWMDLYPKADNKDVTCENDGETFKIIDVTDDSLLCSYDKIAIAVSITLGVLVSIAMAIIITAKRCPYDSKVLLFRFFGIHPQDKYKVDHDFSKEHDVYISCDIDDIQVRQWVKTVLLRKLREEKKRRPYSVFCFLTDADLGRPKQDEIVTNMKKSRRILLLLSPGYFKNNHKSFCLYEAEKSEEEHYSVDSPNGRVIYLLWNDATKEQLKTEPWVSRLETKRVMCPDDRFFWSKLRYELPVKVIRQKRPQDNICDVELVNLDNV